MEEITFKTEKGTVTIPALGFTNQSIYKIPIKKKKKPKNTYKFQGPVNFQHLINDCIEDGNFAFRINRDHCVWIGISKHYAVMEEWNKFGVRVFNSEFLVYRILLKDMQKVARIISDLENSIRMNKIRISRKLRKQRAAGKFSNQPETTVKVF